MRNSFTIQPIPRTYKGRAYRSSLEARWAVFFDLAGIPFLPEAEAYGIEPRRGYLPDFLLPMAKTWIEVKPVSPSKEELRKAELVCVEFQQHIVIVVGDPHTTVEAHWFWSCPWSKAPFSYADLVEGRAVSHHAEGEKLEITPVYIATNQLLSVDEERVYLYAGPQHGAGIGWTQVLGVRNEITDDWDPGSVVPRMSMCGRASMNERTGQCSYSRFQPPWLEDRALTARNWRFW